MKDRIPNITTIEGSIPPINDHQRWRQYIMNDHGSDDGNGTNYLPDVHPPSLSMLVKLDQSDHHKLLSYFARWIKDDGFCEQIGLWIFSVLACIEKPIPSPVYATLREISRKLSAARGEIDDDQDLKSMKSINIIICIIGRYFDQKDMVDE